MRSLLHKIRDIDCTIMLDNNVIIDTRMVKRMGKCKGPQFIGTGVYQAQPMININGLFVNVRSLTNKLP